MHAIRSLAVAASFLVFSLIAIAPASAAEAAFGDKVSADITYYNRALPTVGTAGLLLRDGVAEAARLGFQLIVDLRGPAEGLEQEKAAAIRAGIRYVNIPVTTQLPTDDQVKAFAAIMEDAATHPILIHCHTANRVGAMWALYRAGVGVPAAIALEEGRTAGLKSREAAVRAKLGLGGQGK